MIQEKFFNINEFNDVYIPVGKIIEASQELEQTFKRYAFLKGVKLENLEFRALNKLNNEFHQKGFYDNELYEKLKDIIDRRNFINHNLFLELKKTNITDYNKVSANLNITLFLIYEASDLIENFIDEINGQSGNRPTIFDNKD